MYASRSDKNNPQSNAVFWLQTGNYKFWLSINQLKWKKLNQHKRPNFSTLKQWRQPLEDIKETQTRFNVTWQRATMSKCWAKMSTSLPLPSSPHWDPNTPDTWLSDPIRRISWLDSGATLRDAAADFTEQTTLLDRRRKECRRGWPLKALRWEVSGLVSSLREAIVMATLGKAESVRREKREEQRVSELYKNSQYSGPTFGGASNVWVRKRNVFFYILVI